MGTLAFDTLKSFLENRMSMSHIYQPLMLRTILAQGGHASVHEIAEAFLMEDESQVEYYEYIVTRWPDATLRRKHGLVTKVGDRYELTVEFNCLTEQESQQLIDVCERKLQEYKTRRGRAIWHHREYGLGRIPGKLRYEVLRRARGRCQLCGIPKEERFLEVDHIRPRRAGGATELGNLQALCWRCNSAKGAGDDTDFRKPW